MSYIDKTKIHLAKYKKEKLPQLKDGIWARNNQYYPHILPKENKFENLLPLYKDWLTTYLTENNVKLHRYFHHLNSSQAMCFNFFFPLYHEQALELITDFIGLNNEEINYETVRFEKDGLEAQFGRTPTSFDFYFETTSGKKIYFEIKYTEASFGKAKVNQSKFDSVYSKYLRPLNTNFHSAQKFFENYQILRNLVHIDDNSYVVFVYPTENNGISKKANKVKSDILKTELQNHFNAVTWENLFKSISTSTKNKNLETQYLDFKVKYLPHEKTTNDINPSS